MHLSFWANVRKRAVKWSKFFLPQRLLTYFPPIFIIRNPIVKGIQRSLKKDNEVAVLVLYLTNMKELTELYGESKINECKKTLKKSIKDVIKSKIEQSHSILSLHDYYHEGLSLIVEFEDEKTSVPDLEAMLKKLTFEIENMLLRKYGNLTLQFQIGYMFIEKNKPLDEVIIKAHHQAFAMAEKKVDSGYNSMLYEMNNIIKNRNVRLLAQPIIDVSTKKIEAWEVLCRGPHQTPLEYPLQLFSVARQTGTTFDLEMIILEKAFLLITETGCKQQIFINFTPLTLSNPRFVNELKKLLEVHNEMIPSKIIFEVTERDSIDGLPHFIDNLKKIRTLGFQIAVDDTGAGYASLHTISEILPDIIKIDRSVIQDIDTNSVKESMLKGLLLIAEEIGSLVVAEGIEKAGEAEVLSRNNVHMAQGYFYAKPGLMTI
jgi:EAL domain-containing protein (putative c-di-GMP-specific phosphodiesterase class I)